MTKLNDALTAIEEKRVYSLSEIVTSGLIPFIKSYHTAHKAVLEDRALPRTQRTLNADIIGEGQARTIRIVGKNIQKFLEANPNKLK